MCWQIVTLERSFENDDEEMYEEIARGNKEIKDCKQKSKVDILNRNLEIPTGKSDISESVRNIENLYIEGKMEKLKFGKFFGEKGYT